VRTHDARMGRAGWVPGSCQIGSDLGGSCSENDITLGSCAGRVESGRPAISSSGLASRQLRGRSRNVSVGDVFFDAQQRSVAFRWSDIENEKKNRRGRETDGGGEVIGPNAIERKEVSSESMSLTSSSSRASSKERSRRPGELGGRCTGFPIEESLEGAGVAPLSMMEDGRTKNPGAVKHAVRSKSAAIRIEDRAATSYWPVKTLAIIGIKSGIAREPY
jgi:hypothetical protein